MALDKVHSVIVDPAKIENGYDTVVDVQVPSGGQKRLTSPPRTWTRIKGSGYHESSASTPVIGPAS